MQDWVLREPVDTMKVLRDEASKKRGRGDRSKQDLNDLATEFVKEFLEPSGNTNEYLFLEALAKYDTDYKEDLAGITKITFHRAVVRLYFEEATGATGNRMRTHAYECQTCKTFKTKDDAEKRADGSRERGECAICNTPLVEHKKATKYFLKRTVVQ